MKQANMFPDKESPVTSSGPGIIDSDSLAQREVSEDGGGGGADLASDGATVGCYQTQDLSLDS